MAISPILTMTAAQLEQQVAMYKDILKMINSGASNSSITAKYGFYPSRDEAMRSLTQVEFQLKKVNGTWVDPLPGSFQPPGCGVVGCWGKDAQGRTTLNGQVFTTPPSTPKHSDGTTPLPKAMSTTEKVLLAAAALLVVWLIFKN